MNFAQLPAIKEWVASWRLLAQSKAYLVMSAVLDALFFMAYGFLTAPILDKLTTHIIIIGSLAAEQLRVPAGRMRPAVIDLIFQPPVSQYTYQFLGLLVLLGLVVFVLFCLVQGTNWRFASWLTHRKLGWRQHLLQFARVNLFWFVLYAVWYCIDAVLDLRRIAIEKATGEPSAATGIAWTAVLVLLVYFAVISYPELSIRKGFLLGIRKATTMVPAAIILIAHFLAGNLVVRLIGKVNPAAMFIIGVVVLLLLIAWVRLYITLVVRRAAHGI